MILSNEDSTTELKNNLEIFKDVFEKANPEKLYELFYELTNYFNDVIEKIGYISQTSQAALAENVTIKNALVYVGEWLDNATNVLGEIRDNSNEILNNSRTAQTEVASPSAPANNTAEIQALLNAIVALKTDVTEKISSAYNNIATQQQTVQNRLINVEQNVANIAAQQQNVQSRLAVIEEKLDKLLTEKAAPRGLTPAQSKNIDAKFIALEEALSKISDSIAKE